ncbi:hypothetical protein PQX77_014310 [Marasmius sp. AFHP31]|nr:hypothetical protein PQX77_014310 [Marasmius sp. AFHP31]
MTEYHQSSVVQSPLESSISTSQSSSWNIDPTILQLGLSGLQRIQAERAPSGCHEAPSHVRNDQLNGSLLSTVAPAAVEQTPTSSYPREFNIQHFLDSPGIQSFLQSISGRDLSSVNEGQHSVPEISPLSSNSAPLHGPQVLNSGVAAHEPNSTSAMEIDTNGNTPTTPAATSNGVTDPKTFVTPPPPPNHTYDAASIEQCRTSMLSLVMQNIRLRNGSNNSDLRSNSPSASERAKGVLTDDVCKTFMGKIQDAKLQLWSSGKRRDLFPQKTFSRQPSTRLPSPCPSVPDDYAARSMPRNEILAGAPTAPKAMRNTPDTSRVSSPQRRNVSMDIQASENSEGENVQWNSRKRTYEEVDGDSSAQRPPRVRRRESYAPNPTSRSDPSHVTPPLSHGQIQTTYHDEREYVSRPRDKEPRAQFEEGSSDHSMDLDDEYEMPGSERRRRDRQPNIQMNDLYHSVEPDMPPAKLDTHGKYPHPEPGKSRASRLLTPDSYDMDVGPDSHSDKIAPIGIATHNRVSTGPEPGSASSTGTEQKPILPCHTVPGLWLVKEALQRPGVLECTFEIDAETMQKWQLQQSQTDPAKSTPSTALKLHLLCLSFLEGLRILTLNPNTASAKDAATAIWNADPKQKEWPEQGTLFVQVNPQEHYGSSWMPQDLSPNSPPLDVTGHVGVGTNIIRCVQLAPAPCLFILHASVGTNHDWAGFRKFLGDSDLRDSDSDATVALGT